MYSKGCNLLYARLALALFANIDHMQLAIIQICNANLAIDCLKTEDFMIKY